MSITKDTRQAYVEIDNFIELLDEYNKSKIPQKLREYFKIEKDREYIKDINPNKPIKEQNLKEETLALIAMLNLRYWCEDEKEKERLKRIYVKNENEYQVKLREKYNPDDLFKNKQKVIENEYSNTAIIEYKEDTLFKKIKRFIIRLLKWRKI